MFDEYLAHCSARVARLDMASVTLNSYRTILDGIWRPELGALRFLDVRYSTLVRIADRTGWGKKTHNNAISVLRRAFKFGYRDHPDRADPTRELKGARIQRKDRSLIDPFSLEDAETLIAALRRDWGDAQANYDEFRFFVGLRPSEEIALLVDDYDAARGTLDVTKARVAGVDKDSTKTGDDRQIVLCPRAIGVLKRQLALREQLVRAGKINHDFLFFKANGQPLRNLLFPGKRWQRTLQRTEECPVPSTVHRTPYLGELGSDDRTQRPVGCAAARSQHFDDASLLRGLGGRRRRIRRRDDSRYAQFGLPFAPPNEYRRRSECRPAHRQTVRA